MWPCRLRKSRLSWAVNDAATRASCRTLHGTALRPPGAVAGVEAQDFVPLYQVRAFRAASPLREVRLHRLHCEAAMPLSELIPKRGGSWTD